MQKKLSVFEKLSLLTNRKNILSIFLLFSLILFMRLLTISVIDYQNLQEVKGEIDNIKIVSYVSERVTVKIEEDSNIYYQEYYKRLKDSELNLITKGDVITFFTTKNKKRIVKSIFASNSFKQFDYYPIFSINRDKNFIDVFLYCFYRNTLLNIITNIFVIGTLFYSIPSIAVASWPKRLITIAIAAFFLWLYY